MDESGLDSGSPRSEDAEKLKDESSPAHRYAMELATFYLFLATVLEFLADTLTRERIETGVFELERGAFGLVSLSVRARGPDMLLVSYNVQQRGREYAEGYVSAVRDRG